MLYHDFSSTFCTDTSRIRCCQVCGSVMANNMVSAINSCSLQIIHIILTVIHAVKICKLMKFYLKSVKRAVILYKEVFEFVDRKVISKLAQQIGQMNCFNWKIKNIISVRWMKTTICSCISSSKNRHIFLVTYASLQCLIYPWAILSNRNLNNKNVKFRISCI